MLFTYKILNTIKENNDIIVFVSFFDNKEIYEESFKFKLDTNLATIFEKLQERTLWHENRKLLNQQMFEELKNQMINE
jgi:hypothetical protein